jgi:hypothetical protein
LKTQAVNLGILLFPLYAFHSAPELAAVLRVNVHRSIQTTKLFEYIAPPEALAEFSVKLHCDKVGLNAYVREAELAIAPPFTDTLLVNEQFVINGALAPRMEIAPPDVRDWLSRKMQFVIVGLPSETYMAPPLAWTWSKGEVAFALPPETVKPSSSAVVEFPTALTTRYELSELAPSAPMLPERTLTN